MLSPTSGDAEPLYLGYYRIEKTLGQGSYGKVKLATNIRNGQLYALKFMEKANIKKPVHMTRIKREVRLLKLLHHPGIVKLFEVAETEKEIILTMEYASGGELFDYIVAQRRLNEKDARRLFRQVVSAVDYCHANSVIHRDLKPENLLLDENLNIKIIDFGFSNMFDPTELMGTFCGSPFYASPEMILGKKYTGPEVDVWSLGIILFALLTGHLPFDDANMKRLYNKIVTGEYTFPSYISDNAKDLIRRMIVVDPTQRATMEQVRQHPWLNDGFNAAPDNFMCNRLPIEKIDERIYRKLSVYGFDGDEVQNRLSETGMNPVKATYYLLQERAAREEEAYWKSFRDAQQQQMRFLETITENSTISPAVKCISDHGHAGIDGSATNDMEVLQRTEKEQRRGESGSFGRTEMAPLDNTPLAARSCQASPRIMARPATIASPLRVEQTPEAMQLFPSVQAMTTASATSSPNKTHMPPSIVTHGLDRKATTAPNTPSHTVVATRRFHSMDQDTASKVTTSLAARLKRRLFPNNATSSGRMNPDANCPAIASAGMEGTETGVQGLQLNDRLNHVEEEYREVKGLFNVATSSTRTPQEIVPEVSRVLRENNIDFVYEGHIFHCSEQASSGTKDNVRFEIELCRIRQLGIYGLHLMRISGDTWPYKRLCHRLTSQFRL